MNLLEFPPLSCSPIHHRLPFHNTISSFSVPTPFPASIHSKFTRIRTKSSLNQPPHLPQVQCHHKNNDDTATGDGLIRKAALIGVVTMASKILGLFREVTIAAIFGIGPVATAFKYAYVLPGFSSSLLGGVNGPIHVIMATTLSKLPKERQRRLFRHANAVMFLVGGVVGALVFVSADFIIHIYAPGLWILPEGRTMREIAISQLKIMIPCIVLGGPIGLGYGYMSAEGNNILPSISPAFSSILMITFSFLYALTRRLNAFLAGDKLADLYLGGTLLSCGALLGISLQWVVQVIVVRRGQDNLIPFSWRNVWSDRDLHQFFSLLLPAIMGSGLAQISSFIDLRFASLIPGAAAGLSYAYLLVMTPLGLLSSTVILPLLPSFSKLAKSLSWTSLVENLKRAILLSMVVILPIMSIMCVLSAPITRVLFERRAFDSAASTLVSSLFIVYSLGSPFYVVREILVTVFYALEDGKQPFLVSLGAVALNAVLDWLLVSRFSLGARGLALSTSLTMAFSVSILFHLLQKKLAGTIDYVAFISPILLLLFCSIISGSTASAAYKLMDDRLLSSMFIIRRVLPRVRELLTILLAGAVGMIAFFFPLAMLHFSGLTTLSNILANSNNR